MPQWATVPLWLGLGVVALSVGSVFAFDLLRRWFGIELVPVYKIHSVRWWAEELVVLGVVVGLPLFLIGATLTWSERRRVSQRAATAVELGFCGGCGYDLRSLVAMEDGCVVCPECGAAWRLDSAREG